MTGVNSLWWKGLPENWQMLFEINYVFQYRFSGQMKDELLAIGINPFQNYKLSIKKDFKKFEMEEEMIDKLSGLSIFYAADCGLSSVTGLDKIKNLRLLDLCFNHLSVFDAKCNLQQMEFAYLEKNQLIEIEFIAKCGNLLELNLRENNLKSIEPVSHNKHLKFLDASNNSLKDIKSLANLNHLEELQLELNEITNFSMLQDLPNLKIISIGYNPIDNFEFLFNMKKLKILELNIELKQKKVAWDKLQDNGVKLIFK